MIYRQFKSFFIATGYPVYQDLNWRHYQPTKDNGATLRLSTAVLPYF